MLLIEVAVVTRAHWENLSDSERTRLAGIIKRSRGRPDKLSKRDRDDLRKLVGKLDLQGLGRDLVPFVGRARGSGGKRKR